jgi:hypothetical protein
MPAKVMAALPKDSKPPHHRGASAFDRSMILLYKIVEVLITSHLNILPLRIFIV